MSMFDTTVCPRTSFTLSVLIFPLQPMGRILNRMSKDVDSLDNRLNDSARMTLLTFVQIFGAFIVSFPAFKNLKS